MAENPVLVEKVAHHITVIKINRADKRNAIDAQTALTLHKVFMDFEHDPSQRVAILTCVGPHFSAGADLKAIAEGSPNPLNNSISAPAPLGVTRLFLSKPVIAAVSGYAVAGGLELALWTDIRVADETAVFGVFCRRFGVPLIDGGTIRLPRLIGGSRAMDMILTGRPVSASEALQWGLISYLSPKGTSALETALEIAKQIAAFPQTAMRGDRRSAYEQWGLSLPDALANEFSHGLKSLSESSVAKKTVDQASDEEFVHSHRPTLRRDERAVGLGDTMVENAKLFAQSGLGKRGASIPQQSRL